MATRNGTTGRRARRADGGLKRRPAEPATGAVRSAVELSEILSKDDAQSQSIEQTADAGTAGKSIHGVHEQARQPTETDEQSLAVVRTKRRPILWELNGIRSKFGKEGMLGRIQSTRERRHSKLRPAAA